MIRAPISHTNENGLFAQAVEGITNYDLCRNDIAESALNKAFAMLPYVAVFATYITGATFLQAAQELGGKFHD